jgi:hypothetical protein
MEAEQDAANQPGALARRPAGSPADLLAAARIENETMPDGRSITYYDWPDV